MQDGGNVPRKGEVSKVKSCGGYQLLPLQSANNAFIPIKGCKLTLLSIAAKYKLMFYPEM